jgi:hypothetical protein
VEVNFVGAPSLARYLNWNDWIPGHSWENKRKIPPNPSFDELRTGSLLKGGINCKNEMLK